MSSNKALTRRLRNQVRKRNGELRTQAIVELLMGLVVVAFTFGLLWAATWVFGWMLFSTFAWVNGFALAVTGCFFVVAVISAWRRVNPTASLAPPPQQHPTVEWMEEALSTATGVSTGHPRYAVAGVAMLLLNGPMNVIEAGSTWKHRLPGDDDILSHAAHLLKCCPGGATAKDIRSPQSAILLRRLLLIRFVNTGNSAHLEATERGQRLLKNSRSSS